MTEHEIQKAFVSWFRQTYPGVLIFAIPNGGKRGKLTGAKLKAEGVVAGIPDLFIPAWGLWIEMKTENGYVSKAQKTQLAQLRRSGYTAFACHGLFDAQAAIVRFVTDHLRGYPERAMVKLELQEVACPTTARPMPNGETG